MRRLAWLGVWAMVMASAGCGGDDDVPPGDSGSGADAGPRDAGAGAGDAGVGDAGAPADAAGAPDAAATDAGATDAGATDAGRRMDSGAAPDAGPTMCSSDLGASCEAGAACASGFECMIGRCTPQSRVICGGFAGAPCTGAVYTECLYFTSADFGTCLTPAERACLCALPDAAAHYVCG